MSYFSRFSIGQVNSSMAPPVHTGGRHEYVFATRGGLYAGTPKDGQTTKVRTLLQLLGIENIEFVYAEGLNLSLAHRERFLEAARHAIARLTAGVPEQALAV